MDIQLVLQGADAQEMSQTLTGMMAMAGVQATVKEEDANTYALSIPSAVLAVIENADRAEKQMKANMLLNVLQSFCEGKDVKVIFRSESKDTDLAAMDADALLDLADKLLKK